MNKKRSIYLSIASVIVVALFVGGPSLTLSSGSSSSSANSLAVSSAKTKCENGTYNDGRLRIVIATTKNNIIPISAAMWIPNESGEAEDATGSVFIGSDNRQSSGSSVNESTVVEIGSFNNYTSLTQSAESLGVNNAYEYVYYAHTRRIPVGEYTLKVVIKDKSTEDLRELEKTVAIENCLFQTVVVTVDEAIEETEEISTDGLCYVVYDRSGEIINYTPLVSDVTKNTSIYNNLQEQYPQANYEIVATQCPASEGGADSTPLATQEESDSDDEATTLGTGAAEGGVINSDANTGVGVGVDEGIDLNNVCGSSTSMSSSMLFAKAEKIASISGVCSSALQSAIFDYQSASSGAQKLTELSAASESFKETLETANNAIASGDLTNTSLQELTDLGYSQDDIIGASGLIDEITGALDDVDASDLGEIATKLGTLADEAEAAQFYSTLAEALENGSALETMLENIDAASSALSIYDRLTASGVNASDYLTQATEYADIADELADALGIDSDSVSSITDKISSYTGSSVSNIALSAASSSLGSLGSVVSSFFSSLF